MTLETPKQLAARVGLKERSIRNLIQTGQLEHVMIGCRVHIPHGAFERFIEANTKRREQCLDATKAPDSNGIATAQPITSVGQRTVAAASARLAQQTVNKLKAASRNGYKSEGGSRAQVIQLKS